MGKTVDRLTPEGQALQGQPWQAYPRPQLRRASFYNLNGWWDFALSDSGKAPERWERKILVPYPPQSLLSGVHMPVGQEKHLFYRRSFSLPEDFVKGRLLLHIGAADQLTECWLNGTRIGFHTGGYEPFTFDVTKLYRQENTLVIRVSDELSSGILPYGKQREKRGGMWYTPVSGIWQTVWLESVPERYIHALRMDTDLRGVRIDTGDESLSGTITMEGKTFPLIRGKARIEPDSPHLWSPEEPTLYRFVIEAGEDRAESYFALRTLDIRKVDGIPRLCLNGKPYFFHGLLDQGYWSDGIFTPATPEGYAKDISAMKALGFNTLRKHIKTEPEQFYYECDRLGMVVFQDMVNNGRYSFLTDTLLPTLGVKKRRDKRENPETRRQFLLAMEQTVQRLYNHPCICYWTIFNEGWGQFDGCACYERLRELDSSRFIDTASGWFTEKESDVTSLHIYFKAVRLPQSEKPVVLSEFGGYSYAPPLHVFHPGKSYGYRFFKEEDAFVRELEKLYNEQIIPAVPKGLCAAIYTQVSDVEDETNGLLSYDRQVVKVPEERMQALAARLRIL